MDNIGRMAEEKNQKVIRISSVADGKLSEIAKRNHLSKSKAASRIINHYYASNIGVDMPSSEDFSRMVNVMSLKNVKNVPLFVLYTLLIWLCYFYHFYITFYCFQFTEHLSFLAGLVMFVGGTFAVIVPTPNGAGPWHFAVITMMMLYGVNATDAGIFALIVHGIQTLLVIVLGIYGSLHLALANRAKK